MVIACALRWWENESEILLFNSFHIHYSNLMGLWERERRLHTCREPYGWIVQRWPQHSHRTFCRILQWASGSLNALFSTLSFRWSDFPFL